LLLPFFSSLGFGFFLGSFFLSLLAISVSFIDFSTLFIVNDHVNVLELDSTLGRRVIRRFLSSPGSISSDVPDIMRLSLELQHPRRDAGVCDASLIEVENHFPTTFDLEHFISFGADNTTVLSFRDPLHRIADVVLSS
jgi:hypothetical protein